MISEQGPDSTQIPGETPFPLVVISILNWNGWRDTLECLQSVRKLDYAHYLIVVVDNGSGNDSADRIAAWGRESLMPERKRSN